MAWSYFTPSSGDNTAVCDICHRVIKMGATRWGPASHHRFRVHHGTPQPHEEAPPGGVGPAAGASTPSPASRDGLQAGVHTKKEPEEKEEPEEIDEGVRKGVKGKRSHVWRSVHTVLHILTSAITTQTLHQPPPQALH